jgi:hypothetical protein
MKKVPASTIRRSYTAYPAPSHTGDDHNNESGAPSSVVLGDDFPASSGGNLPWTLQRVIEHSPALRIGKSSDTLLLLLSSVTPEPAEELIE